MHLKRGLGLEQRLELWARWIVGGCNSRSGFASMLEMMMVTRCQFSGGGEPKDQIEMEVEAAVMSLTNCDEKAARILRIEYGAIENGAWAPKSLDKAHTQMDKAHALGLSLRTYKRKLAKARLYVAERIEFR